MRNWKIGIKLEINCKKILSGKSTKLVLLLVNKIDEKTLANYINDLLIRTTDIQ